MGIKTAVIYTSFPASPSSELRMVRNEDVALGEERGRMGIVKRRRRRRKG